MSAPLDFKSRSPWVSVTGYHSMAAIGAGPGGVAILYSLR